MAPCIRMSKSWCPRLANMMATPQSSSFFRRSRRSPSPSRAAPARRCGWGQLLWPCAWAVTVVCASLHCAASAKHPPAIAPMLPPTLCTSCLPCVACACIPAGDTRVVSSQRSAAKSRVVWPCQITDAALGRPDQPSVVTLRCPTRPSRLALRPRYGELWVAAAARLGMIHAPCSCTACVAVVGIVPTGPHVYQSAINGCGNVQDSTQGREDKEAEAQADAGADTEAAGTALALLPGPICCRQR